MSAKVALLLLVLLGSLQSCTPLAPAKPAELAPAEAAEVVAVVDGDTIDVETEAGKVRVRLIGLDTPEIGRNGDADECYAQEARTELNEMIYGRAVELRADPSQANTDKYGRALRHVYIDGQSAALALLESGAAHEYTYDAAYIGQAEHIAAADAAQAEPRGMWKSCQNIPQPH